MSFSSTKATSQRPTEASFKNIEAYEDAWKKKAREVFNSFIDRMVNDHEMEKKSLKESNRLLGKQVEEAQKMIEKLQKRVKKLEEENIRLYQKQSEMSNFLHQSLPSCVVPDDFSKIDVRLDCEQERANLELQTQILQLNRRIKDLEQMNVVNNRQLEDMSINKYLPALMKRAQQQKKLVKMPPNQLSSSFSCLLEKKSGICHTYHRISMKTINELVMNPSDISHLILSNQIRY